MVILIGASFPGKVIGVFAEIKGRLLAVRLQWGSTCATLATIYAPNTQQEPFILNALSSVLASPDSDILIGGDLNLVMNSEMDRSVQRTTQVGAFSKQGLQWLDDHGLRDIWRALHPADKDYTFYSAAHKSYAHLDHFLASTLLARHVTHSEIAPWSLSDHALISIHIAIPPSTALSPGWRLRNSLLRTPDVVRQIKQKITDYLEFNDTGETAFASVWEALKLVLRGEFMAISAAEKRRRVERRAALNQEVAELEQIHKLTGAPRVWRELESRRRALKHLDLDRAEHALLRLCHKFYIGGDKCGKLLASRLHVQAQASMIQTLRDEEGTEHSSDAEIVDIFRAFYQRLYKGQDPPLADPRRYLAGCRLTPMSPTTAESLEVPVRPEEVITAISRLKVGKSPGPDGYTPLFYKCFYFELAPLLTKLFNSFLERGTVTTSMAEAAITVILKPTKDPKNCGSYRPISLLNLDAKLFASVLAARLNPLMTELVAPDQAGFIPTRQGADNTKRLFHLMDGVRRSRRQAFLLAIDAEKAFDRVSWSFLFEVLRAFGDNF